MMDTLIFCLCYCIYTYESYFPADLAIKMGQHHCTFCSSLFFWSLCPCSLTIMLVWDLSSQEEAHIATPEEENMLKRCHSSTLTFNSIVETNTPGCIIQPHHLFHGHLRVKAKVKMGWPWTVSKLRHFSLSPTCSPREKRYRLISSTGNLQTRALPNHSQTLPCTNNK